MAVTTVHLDQPPEAVFAVLADPWRYADWVVGAQRIRAVDEAWPAPGSRFHHRVGVGPLTIDDSTVLEDIDPPRRVVLRARGPAHRRGPGHRRAGGYRRGRHRRDHDRGADLGSGRSPAHPVLDLLVALRNRCSLHRLASVAARQGATGSAT